MPKLKIRKGVSKGKYGGELNFEISEQCVDEEKNFCFDEEFHDKENVVQSSNDIRTFNEIMMDAFQEFESKSHQIRTNALMTIGTQLQLSHNPTFLTEHNETILYIIKTALEGNIPSEIDGVARIISLAAIQLPHSNRSMQVFQKSLMDALNNPNLKSSVRSTVCYAIGILTYLYEENNLEVFTVMKALKKIFLPKNDSHFNEKSQKPNYEFQIAALETWVFLTTLLPPQAEFLPQPYFSFEYYLRAKLPKIIQTLSDKFMTTWEVLKCLEDNIKPRREIRIGKCVLDLNSWELNVRYNMFCYVIGVGNIIKHLSKNEKLLSKIMLGKSTQILSPHCTQTYAFMSYPANQPEQYDLQKLSKNIESAIQKATLEQAKALEEICKELQLNLVPRDFLEDQKNLFSDIILKTIKKGKESVAVLAVRLATLIVLQLGHDEQFCLKLSNIFFDLLRRSETSPLINASICTTLAFFELLGDENTNNVPLMDVLRQIFSGSQVSNEDKLNEQSNLLRIKALEAWGLLLTLCSPKEVCSIVKSHTIKELTEMLHTPNIDFRIACGQVILLVAEQGRLYDGTYLQSDISLVCSVMKSLVNEGYKNISKDKRRTQATKFREILKYLEGESTFSFQLRFADEFHELKTWSSFFKYQKLCEFIGPALTTHLSLNERIRDILPIGPKPVTGIFELKPRKQQQLRSAAMKKSKTKENRLNSRAPKFECV